MLAIMSPAFFKSGPCFEEQCEARKHGLKVIPLLFENFEGEDAPWTQGSEQWASLCDDAGADSDLKLDTMAAFRLIDSDREKLNSEPGLCG